MEQLVGFGFERRFPHVLSTKFGDFGYFNLLSITPFMDELTLDLALKIVAEEKLGKDNVTDFLSIGFSATDIISHWYGPASVESEDNQLRLDRTLERLFRALDRAVGLKHTLIVLSGDHGGPNFPERLAALSPNAAGLPAGRLNATDDIEQVARNAVKSAYGDEALLEAFEYPYAYVSHAKAAEKGLEVDAIARTIAEALMTDPKTRDGIYLALTGTDLMGLTDSNDPVVRGLICNQNQLRSGDVVMVQNPQWQVEDVPAANEGPTAGKDSASLLAHGSPWRYDRYVPIVFAGGTNRRGQQVLRSVHTTSIASTLSLLTGARLPSGSVEGVLPEATTIRTR